MYYTAKIWRESADPNLWGLACFLPFSPTMALNSSALYAGHTLNDDLFKGPDLLNNLVDVVIQFCKNLIAICGAMVKMYHMIAIPEDEQRVHRFLGRKFEVKRQLDT